MSNLKSKFVNLYYEILKIDSIRRNYCWLRYRLRRAHMRTLPSLNEDVGELTVQHNKSTLLGRSAFGMGNRMALLLYPIAASLRGFRDARILLVGPRTEDDIFWAKALGLRNARGLDLFSYSDLIDLGDIHKTDFPSGHFDAVVLGWVISYSRNPSAVFEECKRIIKPGGYLAVGIESNPEHRRTGVYKPPRVNSLNSAREIAELVKLPVTFVHDPVFDRSTDNAVVFQTT